MQAECLRPGFALDLCEEADKGFLHKKGGGVGTGVADAPEGLRGFGDRWAEAQGVWAGGEVVGL